MIDDPNKPAWQAQFFVGMPAPAGAIAAMLPIYLSYSALGLPEGRLFVVVEIVYVLGIAFLMASRIPHFSGKQIGRVPREYFIVVLFAVAVFILALASFPMEVLIALTLSYLALLPFSIRRHARLSAQMDAGPVGVAAVLEPPQSS